jgi:hypothetical protein
MKTENQILREALRNAVDVINDEFGHGDEWFSANQDRDWIIAINEGLRVLSGPTDTTMKYSGGFNAWGKCYVKLGISARDSIGEQRVVCGISSKAAPLCLAIDDVVEALEKCLPEIASGLTHLYLEAMEAK